MKKKEPLIIIAGPTATGKSDAAVRLAKRIGGAVISADSMQVYRGMDVGSAKITKEEMQGVDHYLIDLVDPHEEWNVVRFQKEAKNAIRQIKESGKIPILCGGTGFYIQALLYDIDFTGMDADPEYRSSLEQMAAAHGPEKLHNMLSAVDPRAAASIHPQNIKRIIRALEFHKMSGGEHISTHNEEQRAKEPAYNAAFFVLTMDRAKLYERIDTRVDRMMANSLLEEVKKLQSIGLTSKDVSMQGIGYKQILQSLEGSYDLQEAVRLIKRDTRHFAKRQLTWFKREKEVIWLNIDQINDSDELIETMLTSLREKNIIEQDKTHE